MKLLLINYELPPIGGGGGNATWQIARALIKLGHEATVLTTAFGHRTSPSIEEGVRIHPLPAIRLRPDRSNLLEMASFVISAYRHAPIVARTLGIEGVIAFFTFPSGPIAYHLQKRLSLPYVVSLQGGDVPHFIPSLDPVHWILTPLRRQILAASRAVIANSSGLRELSRKSDPINVAVAHNGIDADFFSPASVESLPAGPFKILFAGRFHHQKNLPMLLRAVKRLTLQHTTPCELHLVGDGPQKSAIERLADTLGISENITWYGWVGKERLRDLYRSTDCFVNPSLIEGMPNTVLEAMACGKPVLASDVPGNRDLVEHGKTGYLFPVGDQCRLEEHLRELAGNRSYALELGRNGRVRAITCFSWEKTARRYLDFLGCTTG